MRSAAWKLTLLPVVLLVFLLPGAARTGAQTWSNDYAYRAPITINHAQVPNTDQTNFPVLIAGTYSYLATVSNGGSVTSPSGYDIIFTSDANGTNVLPFEQESYNPSNGTIGYWVQIPTVSHTSDTVFYMFYGNGAVTTDQSNKQGVWDSHYLGVWHLPDGTTLTAKDSTSNGKNGTINGALAITGQIDGAASFNGSSSDIDIPAYGSSVSAFTISTWIYLNATPSTYTGIVFSRDPSEPVGMDFYNGTANLDYIWNNGSSQTWGWNSGISVPLNQWAYATIAISSAQTVATVCSNGACNSATNAVANVSQTLNTDFLFGNDNCCSYNRWLNGNLDEVRISNIARSSDWTATEYNNQSSPSTFYTIGPAASGGAGGTTNPSIISLSPTSGPVGITIAINGTNFGATQGPSTVTFNGLQASPTVWSASQILVPVPAGAESGGVVVTVLGVATNAVNFTVTSGPGITSLSPASGTVGSTVFVGGVNFDAAQGGSTVTFNGTNATVTSWSNTLITALVPSQATSGNVSVTVGGQTSNTIPFTVSPLPVGWSDTDVGTVGIAGSATYANGVFTIKGSGTGLSGTADGMHFVYQPLSGNGSIVARVVSSTGGQAAVMIRETLNANAADAFASYQSSYIYFFDRASTGANTGSWGDLSHGLPYWIEVARSGTAFSVYASLDGVNWVQIGSTETVTMAQNVYIGLAVSSDSNSSLATATFDNVSINSSAAPSPVITSLSATTGTVGSQVVVSGSGFGASQGSSLVTLNGSPVTINAWSVADIAITIPSGATSGPIVVSVAPNMNDSNPVAFEVTASPLPTSWLDQDVGPTGLAGSSTYANGTFTVSGAGEHLAASDQLHFVYQPLSGDGTIVARIVSVQGSSTEAGVMIRETLSPTAAGAYVFYDSYMYFDYRTSTGGSWNNNGDMVIPGLPYWVELVRAGNTLTAYTSLDGLYWTQLESSETVTMAQNVYIGLAVSSGSNSSLATATFDSVSINSAASPAPVITGLSATTGPIGSQVVVSGSGFGASISTSAVLLNNVPVTIDSWSDTSIIVTIPSGATSGLLMVAVAPSMNCTNGFGFSVTSQALPTPWLDQDVGPVGVVGSASYASGTFTDNASGTGMNGSTDGFHFIYQPLSGDGSIVARLVSLQNGYAPETGIMIRASLDPSAPAACVFLDGTNLTYYYRTSEGSTWAGSSSYGISGLPYWVRLVRTGNVFTAYLSADGVNWTQYNWTSQTITMGQNVYIGLVAATQSNSNPSLTTATFDNVSVTDGTTPFVTGVLPVLGGFGTSVTIAGSNFGPTQGTSTVSFNGTNATSITSWGNSQIVAILPIGATSGPVNVTVNSINGISSASFTVINPVITSVTPPAAPVGGLITINGSGFSTFNGSNSQVQFNGASPVLNGSYPWTDTSVTVPVPTGATSGNLTLIEDGVSSNSVSFTVLEPLTVASVSPTSGAVGSTVTITGTGFGGTQSDSVVTFDGVTAPGIVSWSDTSITVAVPAGASTGPVTVQVADVTADGPTFEVTSGVQLTDSLGNQSSYSALIDGGMWYVSSAQGSGCSSCTLRGNITYQYDSLGNVLSTTDELGNVTSQTYDANDNVTSVTQPAVSGGTPTTAYSYNSFGEVLTTTDPLGHVTTNTYDSHGNLTSVTSPPPGGGASLSETQFAYNSLGELTQITDPLGHVTTMTYTTAGLIASITDPQSNVTTYGYDSRGNRTSVTDALNHTTTFAYDAGNRLTQITYPDSTTASFTYDYRGRRTTATDQNGKTTTYAYDDADRLTSVTDAANNVTQYAYDTENNLLSITDANGHVTNFTYDAFGRVTQTNFPSSHSETYAYDADNNLTSKTDRNGNTIQYVYDALNRLTQKNYPDSTSVEYTYDLVGKILSVNDPTGTYGFAYDNMGRLIGTTTQYSFLTGALSNSYTYDAASNRTGYTAPDGSTNTYSYDTLNRLTTLANSWAGSFGFSYDVLSRRTQMTRPNGVSTSYTYDNLSRLLSVLHQLSGSTIDGAVYTVDSAGNRTSKADELANVTTNYGYDAVYELLQATQGSTTTESYSYDPVGNRLSSLGVSSYTVNSSNELTGTSNASYTHDYNGNTTSKTDSTGTTNYSWDYENRLTSVTLPNSGGTVTFKYDPFGRRIEKISPTTTSIFVYDGDNLVETVNGSGATVARYAAGQNIDEQLAMQRGGTVDYYEQDGLNSVTSLSASNGSLAQSYTYDSFGNQTASSGSLTNFFRYTAREFDTETNLYYNRARYYDPTAGRFLSEDPLGFAIENNFYRYVGNDVMNFDDPSGLSPLFGPDDVARRPCTPGELARCEAMCGDRGVQHCYIPMHRTVIGLTRKGKPRWGWEDSTGPMDCSCNEDPNEPDCEKKREHAPEPDAPGSPDWSPNWNNVAAGAATVAIVGGVVVTAIVCPECLVVAGTVAAVAP